MANDLAGKVLQDDENFRVEIIDWQGKEALKKTAKTSTPKTRAERIKNDTTGMLFFAELTQKHPEINLYSPTVYETGEGYYIREYIDYPTVTNESMDEKAAWPRVEKLAKALAGVDKLEPYGPIGYVGSSNYQNLHASITRWVNENLEAKLISQTQANRALAISKDLGPFIQPRIAHGDMSSYKHAYLRGDQIALIDFENFSTQAARYYDVAWCYTRMASFTSIGLAKHFLGTFLQAAQRPEHQTEQLMAVIIQRSVAAQRDVAVDPDKGGRVEKAARLLDLVLENRLEKLHD